MNTEVERSDALVSALQQRLQARAAELRTEVEDGSQSASPYAGEVVDREDEAAENVRSEIAGAEVARDRAELAQVEAALRRIETGGYGICIDCSEAIPRARLEAQPAALRCARCQEQAESGAGARRAA